MMIGVVLNKPKVTLLKEINLPEPRRNEVRIKLTKVGICGSDVHLFLGHRLLSTPSIIGHEGIGVIDKVGENVFDRLLGERVAVEPNIPCFNCKYCMAGRGNICSNKRIIGVNEAGCFAEYICIPADFAWKIPDEILDEDAVTIEPMAVAYHALFSSKAQSGDAIAIIGLGAIGLLLGHLALRLGYRVFVTEINSDKIEIATKMGAVACLASGDIEQQSKTLEEKWLKEDVVAVFECAGSNFTASIASAAAPRGSEVVLVGLSEKNATFCPLKVAREEITIVPSIIYDHPFDFKRVMQLISSKTIQPSFIISNHQPLTNIQKALLLAAKGNESKIIITI